MCSNNSNTMVEGTVDKYYLMCKDKLTGILSYDFSKDKFSFEEDSEYKGMHPFPAIKFGEVKDKSNPWDELIKDWVDDRVIQENRPDCRDVLEYFNLSYYNKWDICRKNSGMSIDDYFWLTKDLSIDYEDINIRYCAINCIKPKYLAPFPIIKYPSLIDIIGGFEIEWI